MTSALLSGRDMVSHRLSDYASFLSHYLILTEYPHHQTTTWQTKRMSGNIIDKGGHW